MAETELTAPIGAVTVFPDRARVTRTGRLRLSAGEHQVVLDRLPLILQSDSVRVAGRGPATVIGVDVTKRHHPWTVDAAVVQLEDQLRGGRAGLAALDDEGEVLAERLEFLSGLARRSAGTFARALASGDSDPARVAELATALAGQQAGVREERRALAERRRLAAEQVAAWERALDARRGQREPDRLAVVVGLLVEPAGGEAGTGAGVGAGVEVAAEVAVEVELEVSYVVNGAGWHSAYDLRLDGAELNLSWYGLVTQRTGEDWPECDLRLSTARPSNNSTVPELDPWFIDRSRPRPVPPPMMARSAAPMPPGPGMPQQAAGFGGGYGAADMAPMAAMAEIATEVATVEQGATAATYQPARPVAVPADGGSHRATVAVIDLAAVLDYVTAPVRSVDAHLRATVTNSSAHTLLPGVAAVFHGADFIGSTGLQTWAPGEEIELALGVDDRVRVERKLVKRTAGKAVLGGTRRREAEHRITVANHSPSAAKVTVIDQLPVSRDESIVVKETRLEPAPTERTDLGVLTWVLHLEPGHQRDISLGVRVELGRGVELVGWRE